MKKYISSNEIVPQEIGVVESARELESIRCAAFREEEAAVEVYLDEAESHYSWVVDGCVGEWNPMACGEHSFVQRLLEFWRYLEEERWEEDWNLTKAIKAFHAVPAMDWVYCLGFSSFSPRDQLRVKALKFFHTMEEAGPEDLDICLQECRAILSDPLCSEALPSKDIRKMIDLAVAAFEKQLLRLAPEETSRFAA